MYMQVVCTGVQMSVDCIYPIGLELANIGHTHAYSEHDVALQIALDASSWLSLV